MFQASSDISVQFGEFFWCWWSFGFERAGPVYKSHYQWNRSNSNTERTWFRKWWRVKWRRCFLHLRDSKFWRELYFSIAYFCDIWFSILLVFWLQMDNSLCTCFCLVTMQKALNRPSPWRKIFWIQSVWNVVLRGI